MKNYSFLFLTFFFIGSLSAQIGRSTGKIELWTVTDEIGCHPAPLTPPSIAALGFPNTPNVACNGINSPTGDEKLGNSESICLVPDTAGYVFRTIVDVATPPCLVTYNFSADNAFRIYVNGISSPTNVLPASPPNLPDNGVCGSGYSGNNWTAAFSGTLNNADFITGNNTIDFETTNGVSTGGPHPYWLSGNFLIWQFDNLNSSFINNFDYNSATGTLTLNYQTTQQTNGALYSILVERSYSYPNTPIWSPFFTFTNTNKKEFKLHPCPPIPNMYCDEDGSAVRVTFTAMAGTCQKSTTYIWSCNHGFNGGPNEQIAEINSNGDNPNFTLTNEQIKEIHAEYREKLTRDQRFNFSMDSTFAASAGQSRLQVFPNPSNGHLWVNAPELDEGLTPIKIFNQIGELVFESRIHGRQELDLSAFPNGLYFLTSFGDKPGDQHSTQFVLQR